MLPKELSSDILFEDVNLTSESNNSEQNSTTLKRILIKQFRLWFLLCGLLKLFADLLSFCGPLLLNLLIDYVQSSSNEFLGFYYTAGLFLSCLLQAFFSTHFEFQIAKIKIAIKSIAVTSVFNKTIDFSSYNPYYSTGEITNLMNTDVDRMVNFLPSFHQFWSLPLQVVITLYLLYKQIGLVFLGSLGIALIMIVINHFLATKIAKYNVGMMKNKDARISLTTEVLLGLKTVKNHSWENLFEEKINDHRKKELSNLKGIKYLDSGCVFLWASTPIIISLLTFSLYSVLQSVHLQTAQVFTVIALINMLISPLNAFPWVLNGLIESLVSYKRIKKYMDTQKVAVNTYFSNGLLGSVSGKQLLKSTFL